MAVNSAVNVSDAAAPYGGKSAFTQQEHNIVAGYLITAGTTFLLLLCSLFTENLQISRTFLCFLVK